MTKYNIEYFQELVDMKSGIWNQDTNDVIPYPDDYPYDHIIAIDALEAMEQGATHKDLLDEDQEMKEMMSEYLKENGLVPFGG